MGKPKKGTEPDWATIRMEYVTHNISYADLAKKYGLNVAAVNNHGSKEGWRAERKAYMDKKHEKMRKRTLEAAVRKEAARLTKMDRATDLLINKVLKAAEELDRQTTKRTLRRRETTAHTNDEGGKVYVENTITDEQLDVRTNLPLDRAGIRQLAGALRDLRDVMVSLKGENPASEGMKVVVEDYTDAQEAMP